MTKAKEENKDLTGLEASAVIAESGYSKKDSEYNLTESLLKAASFRTSEEAITTIEIKRNGTFYFSFRIHPISDADSRKARKKATTYMPNPQGRKLPPIEKEFNSALFHSNLIYIATVAEDQQKIWNNKEVKERFDILDPIDCIDILLAVGEKLDIVDAIMDISGMSDDVTSAEEYAKN